MVDFLLWAAVLLFGSALLFNAPRFFRKIGRTSGPLRWLAMVWMLMFFGLAMFGVRSTIVASVGDVDSAAINQLIMFGIASAILLGLALGRLGMGNLSRMPVLMMAIYGVLGIVSAAYSPAPALSAYKGALILMDVLIVLVALAYLRDAKPEHKSMLLDLSYFLLSLMVFGAALGGVLYPQIAKHAITGIFGYQLFGLWPMLNPNELGFIGAITGIVALRRLFEKTSWSEKYFWFAQFFMSMLVLVIAQARTSVMSFVLSVLILSVLIRKLRLMGIAAIFLGIVAIGQGALTGGSFGLVELIEEYSARGLSQKQLETMTGRTELWKAGQVMFFDSPLVGHGYDAGVKTLGRNFGVEGAHLHNAYFQVLANSGIAGFVVWFAMLASVAWMVFGRITKMRWPIYPVEDRFRAEVAVVLLIILVRTMTGQVLVTHQYSLLIFMGILVYAISRVRTPMAENRGNYAISPNSSQLRVMKTS